MQTKQLSYLLEIAQQQSLSAASKILHISQPALSQYLSNLEKELGFPLFFSYQRKLFPTSEGSIYLNAAKKIVEVKEHTYQKIASLCQPSEIYFLPSDRADNSGNIPKISLCRNTGERGI